LNKILIILGSCSQKINFFNLIEAFENKGFLLSFLDLEISKFEKIEEARLRLFQRLSEEVSENDVIISHSMGAILFFLILKDLASSQIKENDLISKLKTCKILFLQMPLKKSFFILVFLDLVKYFLVIFLFLYHKAFSDYAKKKLLSIKHKGFFWNQLVMLHGLLSTSPIELFNLINYYRNLEDLTCEGCSEFFKGFDIVFSTGFPDIFCSEKATQALAKKLNKKTIQLAWSFHNPHNFKHSLDKLLKDFFQ
jgi:hypothetical protein